MPASLSFGAEKATVQVNLAGNCFCTHEYGILSQEENSCLIWSEDIKLGSTMAFMGE